MKIPIPPGPPPKGKTRTDALKDFFLNSKELSSNANGKRYHCLIVSTDTSKIRYVPQPPEPAIENSLKWYRSWGYKWTDDKTAKKYTHRIITFTEGKVLLLANDEKVFGNRYLEASSCDTVDPKVKIVHPIQPATSKLKEAKGMKFQKLLTFKPRK